MSVELGGGSTKDQGIDDAVPAGGQDAFAHLYETFAIPLYGYCADLLDDAVVACDVVQDTLVAVDARITRFPDPGRLRVSLYTAARRACMSKLSVPGAAAPAAGEAPAPQQASEPDDLDLALRDDGARGADGQSRSLVTAALAGLAGRDREALSLVYRHNVVGTDLAEVLGMSPYRARSLLHAAGVRFGQAAAVAAVLRAGPAGCRTMLRLAGLQDPAAAPPSSKLGERLGRHLGKCQECARVLGGRSFDPQLIAKVPLEPPIGRLGLRITRTARALGAYRVKLVPPPEVAGPPDQSGGPRAGGPPARSGGRRRGLKAVAASLAAIAVLALVGTAVLRHALIGDPRSPGVKAVSGVQRSGAASPSPAHLPAAAGQKHPAAGHRTSGVPLSGVLPADSSPATSGASPGPADSKSPSPRRSPSPTTPPASTAPPTTPPPTTPPPTPTPSSTTTG
ncbi:MAG TPA: sigma-70 family RNA polymerase sigma factor [Streptosporangiaceae bacterium]|nr:sigma-70 family RNA polymerase sigma factor [Streptosporangiaceae bacterium]